MAGFLNDEVILSHREVSNAVINLGVLEAFRHVYCRKVIAILEGAGFPIAFFADANIGIQDAQIVQVDQEVKFLEPIQAGDKLYYDVYGESVRQAHGTDIIVLKSVVSNEAGDIVQESYTTLAGRSEENGESGFNDGSA